MTMNLRVQSQNDGNNSWPFRVNEAAQVIRDSGAALVGTQEALFSMLQELMPQLEDYAWFGAGRDGGDQGEAVAILYNKKELALLESGDFWLSEAPEQIGSRSWGTHYVRICTWGLFQSLLQPTVKLLMFNTHLDNGSQEAREQGIRLIWQRIVQQREKHGCPCMLTGDFNAAPQNKVVRFLDGLEELDSLRSDLHSAYQYFSRHNEEVGRTLHRYHGGEAGEPIDYIYATQEVNLVFTYVDRRTINGRYPSDHYPVVSRLEL